MALGWVWAMEDQLQLYTVVAAGWVQPSLVPQGPWQVGSGSPICPLYLWFYVHLIPFANDAMC